VTYLILILIVGVIVYYFKRNFPRTNSAQDVELPIKVTISTSVASPLNREKIDSGDVVSVENGHVLNPKSPLPLTINGLSITDARKLKGYLDEEINWGRKLDEITYLLAQTNATCKEVEEYIAKFKPQYKQAIERLKDASPEWKVASEKDKEDILMEFQQKALDSLTVRPSDPDVFEALFDDLPSDVTADDKLLENFAGDTGLYSFYVSHLWTAGQVKTVPPDDYYRKKYEALVGKGLAIRGQDIGMEQVLNGLRLKDINEVVKGLVEKPFGRKVKAIEFAMSVPDIKERLGRVIAFRELFQLRELDGIDFNEIQKCYRHARAVATLIKDTYVAGAYTLRTSDEAKDIKYDSWKISAGNCCDGCKTYHEKKYKRRPSKLPPFHLGCNCQLEGEFDGM
jgi:hypothetical protein